MTAVAVWTTVACAAGADEPDVPRVESTGEAPRPGELGAMDAGLVGLRTGRNDEYVTYNCADLSTPLFNVVLRRSSPSSATTGSSPSRPASEVGHAVAAVGRARRLGATAALPPSWRSSTAVIAASSAPTARTT